MNLRGRIVVLGGYGHFGSRIARALALDGRHDVYIAGPKRERATALARQLADELDTACVHGIALDYSSPKFVRELGSIAPIVVVHCAGPFQSQDYRVAEACLACRSHYLDLADAREFVTGIASLDRLARRRDVLIVSGASTLPGISSAVVEALASDLCSVSSIETSIAATGQASRGKATLAAALSYCGKPIHVLERGSWTVHYGWQDSRVLAFRSFRRRVACCDVPDLDLFPTRYPGLETARFHAGSERLWQHAALWLMAAMVRVRLVRDWSRYARFVAALDGWTRSNGRIGAMQVRVGGRTTSGRQVSRVWELTAHGRHGPEIPCAPAVVLAQKLASGKTSERGAKPCLGLVRLDELERALAAFDIETHFNEEVAAPCSVPI